MLIKTKKLIKGFTFVEVIISLALTAMILAAIATAFHAYAENYNYNQAIYKTTTDCRQALARITQQLRTATAVDHTTSNQVCSFISAGGDNLTYSFSDIEDKLYLYTATGNHIVCENVTDAAFTKDTAVDSHGITYVKSVQISMTVNSQGVSKTLPAAVTIRRNLQ